MSGILAGVNLLSIFLQQQSFLKGLEKTGAYGTTVAAINTSDLSFAISFVMIWSGDLYFKGTFALQEETWRSGSMCHIIFGLFLKYSLLSPTLISFWSLSRLAVVLHPLDTKFKETKFVLQCTQIGFAVASFAAIILTIFVWLLVSKIPTSLCSPFADPTNNITIIKAFIWTQAIFQLFAIIFICVVHCCLVASLTKSQKNIKQPGKHSNRTIIGQLIFVTFANALAWISSTVVFVVCMFLVRYETDMFIWTIVFVLPQNSILNLTVFVATSTTKLLRNTWIYLVPTSTSSFQSGNKNNFQCLLVQNLVPCGAQSSQTSQEATPAVSEHALCLKIRHWSIYVFSVW